MAKKILVIDDAPSIIQLMEYWLKEAGYQILIAKDGLEGYESAKKNKPDLIILDVMIPKLDGFSLCRLLKSDEQCRNIPIIIVTAREQKDDKELGRQAGANIYIEKPIEQDVLLGTIKKLLK